MVKTRFFGHLHVNCCLKHVLNYMIWSRFSFLISVFFHLKNIAFCLLPYVDFFYMYVLLNSKFSNAFVNRSIQTPLTLLVFNSKFVFALNYTKDVGYLVMYARSTIDWHGQVVQHFITITHIKILSTIIITRSRYE